jgi:hypothetical protein
MSHKVNQFFAKHKKLDIAYKVIHWTIATFILIIGFFPIMFFVLIWGFDPLYLYGFNSEEIKWSKWRSWKERFVYWSIILFLLALFLIVAGR